MNTAAIDLFYKIILTGQIIGMHLATAVFFYILLKAFVKKKRALLASVLFFASVTILYYIPPTVPKIVSYTISIIVVFLTITVGDTVAWRLKAFISITGFVLRWLALGTTQQLMMLINNFTTKLLEKYSYSITMLNVVFLLTQIVQLLLIVFFLWLSVRLFLRVFKNVNEELSGKEFAMLIMPMLAQMVGYQSVVNYYDLYDKAIRGGVIEPVYSFEPTLMIFYVFSYVSIIAFLTFYRQLKTADENRREQELLASQVESLKTHIALVENNYEEIRSIRHDMANHIMILGGLIENEDQKAAEQYVQKLKQTIADTGSDIKSQNPVTDALLSEYAEKFKKENIAFECEFHYPVSENLDSFDMSIILFNALQNAYEAAKGTKAASVEVHTFRKKNTFVIRIENTYAKDIHMDEITGLPMTDKSDKCAHGYGLKNIMRIAHKYYGDIQVEADGEKFILNIMIMLQ